MPFVRVPGVEAKIGNPWHDAELVLYQAVDENGHPLAEPPRTYLEVTEKKKAAHIIALIPDDEFPECQRIVLVGQERQVMDSNLAVRSMLTYEIPAGYIEEEDPRDAAFRELREETGFEAEILIQVTPPLTVYPGVFPRLSEHLFRASGLRKVAEPEEGVKVMVASLEDAAVMIGNGLIIDPITCLAIFMAATRTRFPFNLLPAAAPKSQRRTPAY